MIDQRVRNRWVERLESAQDRRVKTVSLTSEGRQLMERGISARRKWLSDLAATFTPEQRVEPKACCV